MDVRNNEETWYEDIIDFSYETSGIILALTMLIVGSIIDVWKGEIHDYFWIGFGVVGFGLVFLSSDIMGNLAIVGFSLIVAPFVMLMWRMGLFGGADAFALIALAVIAPMATLGDNIVTPFTALSNAAILFVIPFIVNFLRNILAQAKGSDIFEGFEETSGKKILAMLMGYKAKNPKFAFSIEKTVKGKKKLDLRIHHAEFGELINKTKSDLKILTDLSPEDSHIFENIQNKKIKKIDDKNREDFCFIIKDDSEVIFFISNKEIKGMLAVWTDSKAFVTTLRSLFSLMWKKSHHPDQTDAESILGAEITYEHRLREIEQEKIILNYLQENFQLLDKADKVAN